MIDVAVAADITNTITYPTAVPAAKSRVRPALATDPTIFPAEDSIETYFTFAPIDPQTLHLITRMWLEFKAGG
jgi:spermidine/putrescine-binding protein